MTTTLTECEDCGQCFAAEPTSGNVCPDCEQEHAEIAAGHEEQRRVENALDCRCGAWGFSPSGQVYHVADCVCGRT